MKVLVFGTFDQLHPGHEFVLREASKRGDLHVVVALDKNVELIKGRRSVQNEKERQRVVQEVFPEARVLLGSSKDFLDPVREIQPDLILLGYDQKLPPGVKEADLPCEIERLEPFEPQHHKSSLNRT